MGVVKSEYVFVDVKMNDWLKVEGAQYNFAAICRGLLVWAALLWTMIPGTAAASARAARKRPSAGRRETPGAGRWETLTSKESSNTMSLPAAQVPERSRNQIRKGGGGTLSVLFDGEHSMESVRCCSVESPSIGH